MGLIDGLLSVIYPEVCEVCGTPLFVQLVEFRGLVIAGERHGGMASETHHLFAMPGHSSATNTAMPAGDA